jgi:hypothetical protein
MTCGNGRSWYWSQPQNGYYSGDDEWVIRRHIALLEAAGVDVIGFDTTNGHPETQAPIYLKIMAVIRRIRMEGTPVHIKTFHYTHATSPATVNWLYTLFTNPVSTETSGTCGRASRSSSATPTPRFRARC